MYLSLGLHVIRVFSVFLEVLLVGRSFSRLVNRGLQPKIPRISAFALMPKEAT